MMTVPQLRAERITRTLDAVRDVADGRGPIVVGPWLGEVGFEMLYWIPFVRWVLTEVSIDRQRLVVVSRGGCAHWYADLANQYVEIFDYLSPDELRVLNRERMAEQAATGPEHGLHLGQMTAKQYGMTKAELEILQRVGHEGSRLLHPSIMFLLFRLYWRKRLRDLYIRCARPMPIPRPAAVRGGPYVAVKFYSSHACTDRAGTAEALRQLVGVVADRMPVVVLDSGDRYDDHGAFDVRGDNITVLSGLEPRTNLAVQTSVIAHASAFVGTYGGFAYLAPMLGVPTTALYAEKTFRDDHYETASTVFRQWRVRFDVSDLETGFVKLQRTGGLCAA